MKKFKFVAYFKNNFVSGECDGDCQDVDEAAALENIRANTAESLNIEPENIYRINLVEA